MIETNASRIIGFYQDLKHEAELQALNPLLLKSLHANCRIPDFRHLLQAKDNPQELQLPSCWLLQAMEARHFQDRWLVLEQ